MISLEVVTALADGVLYLGILAALLFTLHYGLTAPWWKTSIGRMFILLGGSIVSFGIVATLSLLFGMDYPGREYVRLAGFGLFAVAEITLLTTYLVERGVPLSVFPRRKPKGTAVSLIIEPLPALVTRKPGDIARKVVAYAVAGMTSTGIIAVAGLFGLEVGPEVAAAVVTILGVLAGYFTRDRAAV